MMEITEGSVGRDQEADKFWEVLIFRKEDWLE